MEAGGKERGKARRQKRKETGREEREPSHHTGKEQPYDGTFIDRPVWLHVPSLLEKLLNDRLPPKIQGSKDRYLWVVATIIHVEAFDDRYRDDGCYVRLNYELLRSIIGKKHAKGILMDLEKWGVIECDRSWRKGCYSMGYRLTRQFREARIRQKLVQDRLINKKVNRHRRAQVERVRSQPAYAAVHATVDALSIDRRKARRLVDLTYPDNRTKHRCRMVVIDALAWHTSFHTIDNKTGRYYHLFACLARELRHMVRINGEALVEVDVTSCQPLLLHLLLRQSSGMDPLEAARMEELVLNGRFYETLNTSGLEREAFKKEFYKKVLFCRDYPNTTMEAFTRMFPSYAIGIRKMKQGDHSKLAIAMQKMEAGIIFEAVGRFLQRFANAPIVTIHDSLLTTAQYNEDVKKVLVEVFQERYGITPHLKMKSAA